MLMEDEAPPAKDKVVVTRKELFVNIREKIHEEKALVALPLCLLLFAMFLGMVIWHERNTDRQAFVDAINTDILENAVFEYDGPLMLMGFKNMQDVHSIRDMWEFFILGMWPQMMWQNSDGVVGRYLNFNQIIGGARLMTQTFIETEGRCVSRIASKFHMKCMIAYEDDLTAVGGDDLAQQPRGEETSTWSSGPMYDSSAQKSKEYFMYQNQTLNFTWPLHLSKLRNLRANNFINRTSRQVIMSVVMFNADLHMLALVEVIFFQSRTGTVWSMLRTMPLDPNVLRDVFPVIVFDMLWLVLLFLGPASDFATFIRLAHRVGIFRMKPHVPHGLAWYFIDVVGVVCGLILIFTLSAFITQTLNIQKFIVDNFDQIQYDTATFDRLITDVEQAVHKDHLLYRSVLLIYPINLLVRLGIAFGMQPRLSITPRIIVQAFTDLYHFVIVFMTVIICFAMISFIIYGRDLDDYSTFPRALLTSVRMAFGDIDWDQLSVVAYVFSSSFYAVFQCVVGLILFNFLLAIVVDSYEEVRNTLGTSTPTLRMQIQEHIGDRRRIWRKEKIALPVLWMNCFEEFQLNMFDDVPVTSDELVKAVPGLSREQAKSLFDDVITKREISDNKNVKLTHVMTAAERIEKAFQQLPTMFSRFSAEDSIRSPRFPAEQKWPPTYVTLPTDELDTEREDSNLNLSNLTAVLKYARALAANDTPLVQSAIDLALADSAEDTDLPSPKKVSYLLIDNPGT